MLIVEISLWFRNLCVRFRYLSGSTVSYSVEPRVEPSF